MSKRRVILLTVAAFLTGCASAPKPVGPSPFLEPSSGAPNLFVSRPDTGSAGAALDYFLYIDGHKGPKLDRGTKLQLRVAAGRRTLTVQPFFLGTVDSRATSTTIEVPSEGTVYARFGVAFGGFTFAPGVALANLNFVIQQVDIATWESGR